MADTPNYEINYDDERFDKVQTDKDAALDNLDNTYDGIISGTDKYYDDLKNQIDDRAKEQAQIQQDNTDFAIEKIEQEKEKEHKDYLKEQSGAYVDWQKQSNQYGVNAEKMASAGLANTGFSESSQVSMYNTYQNRVATARESYKYAVLNYNNAIKDAQLQNNAALAQIAADALQKQLELSLEGFQYKNQLLLEKANKKTELENTYYQRYLDILNQMNTENALKEDIRQFEENKKFTAEQNELNRQHELARDELNRKFEAEQAELARKHDKEMLAAKTKAEKELLDKQHKLEMEKLKKQQQYELAQLNQKLANDKALMKYQQSLSNSGSGGSGGSRITGSSGGKNSKPKDTVADLKGALSTFNGSTYSEAVAWMKQRGVSSAVASAAMTESEWSRRKNSYSMTGQGAYEVKNFSSYKEYIQYYVKYCISNK